MHNKVAHRAHRAGAKPHKEIYKARLKSGWSKGGSLKVYPSLALQIYKQKPEPTNKTIKRKRAIKGVKILTTHIYDTFPPAKVQTLN